MNRLIVLVLTSLLILTACGDHNEKHQEKDTKPKVEVKVNPEKKSNDKKQSEKKTKESNIEKSTESDEAVVHIDSNEGIQANYIDANKYNQARDCLVNGNSNQQCHAIAETKEYSKAWNNLTNEGYNCKNGACYEMSEEQRNPKTHEQPSTVQPSVEMSTEQPTTEAPTTEMPSTESPTSEQHKQITTEDATGEVE